MFRIDDPNAVATLPNDFAPTGSPPGYFTNGQPGQQPATPVPDWWLNQVQEEPLAVLAKAGVVPAKGTNNQLLTSLLKLFGVTLVTAGPTALVLPSALIIQQFSGPNSAVNNNPNAPQQWAANFPEPFPNACISVSVVDGANGCILWNSISSLSKTTVQGWVWSTVSGTSRVGNPSITAIGY